MKLHANAALSWSGRRLLAERVLVDGWTLSAAAEAAGVSVRCARKWVGRFQVEGEQGLCDRSSAPHTVRNRTPPERVAVIVSLRRLRMTAAEIAETLAMPLSTVSAVLKRSGLGRLGRIGLERAVRYERSRPGELVHIDVKKLGRIEGGAGKRVAGQGNSPYNTQRTDAAGKRRNTVGWEYVHIAVDDHSRLAYAEVLPDGATIHAIACKALGVRHIRTRPYRPQTNGKAERFIRTLLAGWAYGAIYTSSKQRTRALDGWLWHYNHRRRHSALGHQPPVSRTNLLGSYT
jgi:transposase